MRKEISIDLFLAGQKSCVRNVQMAKAAAVLRNHNGVVCILNMIDKMVEGPAAHTQTIFSAAAGPNFFTKAASHDSKVTEHPFVFMSGILQNKNQPFAVQIGLMKRRRILNHEVICNSPERIRSGFAVRS